MKACYVSLSLTYDSTEMCILLLLLLSIYQIMQDVDESFEKKHCIFSKRLNTYGTTVANFTAQAPKT